MFGEEVQMGVEMMMKMLSAHSATMGSQRWRRWKSRMSSGELSSSASVRGSYKMDRPCGQLMVRSV